MTTASANFILSTVTIVAALAVMMATGAAAAAYDPAINCSSTTFSQSESNCNYAGNSLGGTCMWNPVGLMCDWACGDSTTKIACDAKQYRGCVFDAASAKCTLNCDLLKDAIACMDTAHQGQCSWDYTTSTCSIGCNHATVNASLTSCNALSSCNWVASTSQCFPKCPIYSGTSTYINNCNRNRECTSISGNCVTDCEKLGAACPSEYCVATGTTRSTALACTAKCSDLTTESACSDMPQTCGWYRADSLDTPSCRPRCEQYKYAACPTHCKAGKYSFSSCEPKSCSVFAEENDCQRHECVWKDGKCNAPCPIRATQAECSVLTHCNWEMTVNGGSMCTVDCSLGDSLSCGRTYTNGAFANCTKISYMHPQTGLTLTTCTPQCSKHKKSECPLASCVPSNTTSTLTSYHCIPQCGAHNGKPDACTLSGCNYDYATSKCHTDCTDLRYAACDQASTGGMCRQKPSYSVCERSCSQIKSSDACVGRLTNPTVKECLWSPLTKTCTDTCVGKGASTEEACNAYTACWFNRRVSSYSRRCMPRCELANGYRSYTCTSSLSNCRAMTTYPPSINTGIVANCTQDCGDFSSSSYVGSCDATNTCMRYSAFRTTTCKSPCNTYATASECDARAGDCVWTGATCQLECSHIKFSNYSCPTHCRKSSSSYASCYSECDDYKTAASCFHHKCVWDSKTTKCFTSCDKVPASSCEVGTDKLCVTTTGRNGAVCATNCTKSSFNSCPYFNSQTRCQTHTDYSQSPSVKFCTQECDTYLADNCPTALNCKVETIGQYRTDSGRARCRYDCTQTELQATSANCAGMSDGHCAWFGKDKAQPCQLGCDEYDSAAICPTDRCVQSTKSPYCRAKCSLLKDLSSCRIHPYCLWDSVNDKCRDSCGAIWATGHPTGTCTEVLPWCVKHGNSSNCDTDCNLAAKSECGFSHFNHCQYNQFTRKCVLDCREFSKTKCPLGICEIVNNTRSSTSTQYTVCTKNCSWFDGSHVACSQMVGDCVYLQDTGKCVVDCNRIMYMPAERVPAHCADTKTCSSYSSCNNNCTLLSNYSCGSDSSCVWTGSVCNVTCSSYSYYQRTNVDYCNPVPSQPSPQLSVYTPRVWPGADIPDLLPTTTVAPASPDGGTGSVGGGSSGSTPAPPAVLVLEMSLVFDGNATIYDWLLSNNETLVSQALSTDIVAIVKQAATRDSNPTVVITNMQSGSLIVNFTLETSYQGEDMRTVIGHEASNNYHFPLTRSLYNTAATTTASSAVIPFKLRTVGFHGTKDSGSISGSGASGFCGIAVALVVSLLFALLS